MTQAKTVYTLLCFVTVVYRFCLAGVLQKPEIDSCIFYYEDPNPNTLVCNLTYVKESDSKAHYTCIQRFLQNELIRSQCIPMGNCCSTYKLFDLRRCIRNGLNSQAGDHVEGTFINRSCTFHNVHLYPPYCVQLKAGGDNGTCVNFSSQNILKFDPPQLNELEPVPGMKRMLRVSWTRPRKIPNYDSFLFDTRCQIRYTATTQNHQGELIVFGNKASINLTNLQHCTNYTVDLRCRLNRSRFWSEWSNKKTGTTTKPAPSKVDLWRIIELHPSNGKRMVRLLWMENEEFKCSGITNNYTIRYSTENQTYIEYTKKSTFILPLTEEAYVIGVAAINIIGKSPEATLKIPSISEENMDHQRIIILNASALKEQMFLEWEVSDLDINGYIIEWYNDLEPNSYKRSWQKITNVTKWTSPKGAFIRFNRYKISVYPLLNGEIKVPSSTRTYFHEGIPSEGPSVEPAENIDKNTATIKWKEIPEVKRNGVIISYTVFYKSEDGKELGETVNGRVLHYQLTSLQANTKYAVKVMASTVAGGKNGTAVVFITSKLGVADIILICILIGMLMLCLLTVGILGAVKRHTLKRILWPPIPHPFITTTTITTTQKQVPVWRNSPMDETHSISLEIYPCSDKCGELQLLNYENSVKQKNVPDNLRDREYEVLISLPTIPLMEHNIKSPALPALKVGPHDYENIEDQSHLNQTFNPYLKNSVSKRVFLEFENSDENAEGPCLPNSIAHPSVLPNKVAPFRKQHQLQDT